MSSNSVALTGQEHLPPVLRLITDSSYRYSSHKHTIEDRGDGIEHTYTVVVSNKPLNGKTFEEILVENEKKKNAKKTAPKAVSSSSSLGHLVSQISSTTSSEKRSSMGDRRSPIVNTGPLKSIAATPKHESQYMTLGSLGTLCSGTSDSSGTVTLPVAKLSQETYSSITGSSTPSEETQPSTRPIIKARVRPGSPQETLPISSLDSTGMGSLGSVKSLPKFTFSSSSIKSIRSAKYVMMVHVKFILLHRDFFSRKVQSTFIEEFASDLSLEDVIFSFHQLCIRLFRLGENDFKPRLSFCVGELNHSNSKPIQMSDMKKTLAQLAGSHAITKFALIADNIH